MRATWAAKLRTDADRLVRQYGRRSAAVSYRHNLRVAIENFNVGAAGDLAFKLAYVMRPERTLVVGPFTVQWRCMGDVWITLVDADGKPVAFDSRERAEEVLDNDPGWWGVQLRIIGRIGE